MPVYKVESDEEDLGYDIVPRQKEDEDDAMAWDVDDEDVDARKQEYIKRMS